MVLVVGRMSAPQVTYTAEYTGFAEMFVTYRDAAGASSPISGSPFNIQVAATVGFPAAATSVVLGPDRVPIVDSLNDIEAGEDIELFVELADDVGVGLPPGGEDFARLIRLSILPAPLYTPAVFAVASEGIYRFTFAARVAGSYFVEVLLNEEPVANSGLKIPVVPAPTSGFNTQVRESLGGRPRLCG